MSKNIVRKRAIDLQFATILSNANSGNRYSICSVCLSIKRPENCSSTLLISLANDYRQIQVQRLCAQKAIHPEHWHGGWSPTNAQWIERQQHLILNLEQLQFGKIGSSFIWRVFNLELLMIIFQSILLHSVGHKQAQLVRNFPKKWSSSTVAKCEMCAFINFGCIFDEIGKKNMGQTPAEKIHRWTRSRVEYASCGITICKLTTALFLTRSHMHCVWTTHIQLGFAFNINSLIFPVGRNIMIKKKCARLW